MGMAIPRGPSTVAVRNVGQVELPLTANVVDWARGPQPEHANVRQMFQGNGAQRSYTMDPNVDEVEVMITSDGQPMSARIEILPHGVPPESLGRTERAGWRRSLHWRASAAGGTVMLFLATYWCGGSQRQIGREGSRVDA